MCAHSGKNTGAGQRSEGTRRSAQSQRQCFSYTTGNIQIIFQLHRLSARLPQKIMMANVFACSPDGAHSP